MQNEGGPEVAQNAHGNTTTSKNVANVSQGKFQTGIPPCSSSVHGARILELERELWDLPRNVSQLDDRCLLLGRRSNRVNISTSRGQIGPRDSIVSRTSDIAIAEM